MRVQVRVVEAKVLHVLRSDTLGRHGHGECVCDVCSCSYRTLCQSLFPIPPKNNSSDRWSKSLIWAPSWDTNNPVMRINRSSSNELFMVGNILLDWITRRFMNFLFPTIEFNRLHGILKRYGFLLFICVWFGLNGSMRHGNPARRGIFRSEYAESDVHPLLLLLLVWEPSIGGKGPRAYWTRLKGYRRCCH